MTAAPNRAAKEENRRRGDPRGDARACRWAEPAAPGNRTSAPRPRAHRGAWRAAREAKNSRLGLATPARVLASGQWRAKAANGIRKAASFTVKSWCADTSAQGGGGDEDKDPDFKKGVQIAATKTKGLFARSRTLIAIGWEGPEFDSVDEPGKTVYHPNAGDAKWRAIVKSAIKDYMNSITEEQSEWKIDVSRADVKGFKNLDDLKSILGSGKYDNVVIYSHGWSGGLVPIIGKTQILAADLGAALVSANVSRALILGCESSGLAQSAAATQNFTGQIGGIDFIRDDHISAGNKKLDILNSIIMGYPTR